MPNALVFPWLAKASKTAIFRILDDLDIKPHKIEYYCERRDPEFDGKMHNVLVACKQLSFNFDENAGLAATDSGEPQIHALINTTKA